MKWILFAVILAWQPAAYSEETRDRDLEERIKQALTTEGIGLEMSFVLTRTHGRVWSKNVKIKGRILYRDVEVYCPSYCEAYASRSAIYKVGSRKYFVDLRLRNVSNPRRPVLRYHQYGGEYFAQMDYGMYYSMPDPAFLNLIDSKAGINVGKIDYYSGTIWDGLYVLLFQPRSYNLPTQVDMGMRIGLVKGIYGQRFYDLYLQSVALSPHGGLPKENILIGAQK